MWSRTPQAQRRLRPVYCRADVAALTTSWPRMAVHPGCGSVASSSSASAPPHSATSASSSSSSASQMSFLEFAWTARSDVAAILKKHKGGAWTDRVDGLSNVALELWPREAPHWRVAAPLVVPSATQDTQRFAEGISATLAVREPGTAAGERGDSTGSPGLGPDSRAVWLRTFCGLRNSRRTSRYITPLLAALVDGGGVHGSTKGLAMQLSLEDLQLCVLAIGQSTRRPLLAALNSFMGDAAGRLSSVRAQLQFGELNGLRSAFHSCGVPCEEIDTELRRRLQLLSKSSADEDADHELRKVPERLRAANSEALDVVTVVVAASSLGEHNALRGQLLRRSLLPASLPPGSAARVLPHALPQQGSAGAAQDFVVAMAADRVASGARQLDVSEITSALRAVFALQAKGSDFAIQEAARVLRALWPRVSLRLPNLGPEGLSLALRTYWWQLHYSRQEYALAGIARQHPVVNMVRETSEGSWASRSRVKDHDATEDLKAKLLWPTLSRLPEMPLAHVGACLAAIAPPVCPPDVLNDVDRAAVRRAVESAFPPGRGSTIGRPPLPAELLATVPEEELSGWWEDFWDAEVRELSAAELLEVACGLREAAPDLHDPERGKTWWVLDSLLTELQRRLRPTAGQQRPSVELSHFLLLRMCRVMDLWQGHEVEEVLKHLLSSPDAVRPLPTSLFVAVLGALRDFSVPKELPLRLTAAFLDRVDRGEREVQPTQWADLLCIVRALDEPPSWERVTPRIVQHLVPKLEALPAPVFANVLRSLASRPLPLDLRSGLLGGQGCSPLEMAPVVTASIVTKTMHGAKWDFHEVSDVLGSLGRLGWYSDAATAASLTRCMQTSYLEAHAPLLLRLVRACVDLRVHHAPLLHKIVLWYTWLYTYLRPKPLPSAQVDELIALAEHLLDLSFQSIELHGILAENLNNPNASPRQVLALLAALARLSHFPPAFKEACSRICSESSDSDLASLSNADLVSAFNIHLCAVFDGPAALKHWLTEDEAMKAFFQVHTSQKWYQSQDRDRATFLQSSAYLTLREAAEAEGLELRPSDPGEVYHVELVSKDAKERLNTWSNNPPDAVVCIKSKEQLQWYVPITADSTVEVEPTQNRCHQFSFMFRGSVQKIRHLQAMGYRVAVVWMSEWTKLDTPEKRQQYLRDVLGGGSGSSRDRTAFSPSSEQDAYV